MGTKMKRLIILICTACWLTVCAQGSESPTYEMYYTVTPDTANHYLDIRLDYERKEAGNAELVLNMPRWAPDYDRLLAPAGLCIDKANWKIRCVENPDASQLAFQKSMGL